MKKFDKIIIGGGIYGLYSALYSSKKGQNVIVLEKEKSAFKRATLINQARIHQGYHYPRSLSTAIKSAHYFDRFNNEFEFCINNEFDQIYATSSYFSWCNAYQFVKFCKDANIPCEKINEGMYFKSNMCDGVFKTREYAYDAKILCDYFLSELDLYKENCKILYNIDILEIIKLNDKYEIVTNQGRFGSSFILNATYASVNQILSKVKFEPFKIKYELCEIILCDINEKMKNIGLTVMDGPFFSIMPFGKTGYHSLTSVTFTPHETSYKPLPTFDCQNMCNGYCSKQQLGNCNYCIAKPETSYNYMANLAHKYINNDLKFTYAKSLYSMKPILMSSEVDDSRPTVIKQHSINPTFVSVLSGKINTIYDLDEVLDNG